MNKDLTDFEEVRGEDAKLVAALGSFRQSVHAWSHAEYGRGQTLAPTRRTMWRRSAAWAMGLLLAVGAAGGGFYQHHEKVERARLAEQQRQQELAKRLAAERAREAEDLMAKVDSDVSREVPSAMEPLARLMDDSQ